MRVYISGPISGVPIEEARLAFKSAADVMAARGHEPVNPCELPTVEGCPCPDVESTEGSGSGHTWSCYMRKDIAALATCDAILMLPGWQGSHGARRELDVANTLGLLPMFPVEASWLRIPHPAALVVEEILAELARAEAKFPDQHLPDGTGRHVVWGITGSASWAADQARLMCQQADADGFVTWLHVVREEVAEAFAEDDPARLRPELVQVAAMAIRWIQDIDRRASAEPVAVEGRTDG